jgi:hypothetical protein
MSTMSTLAHAPIMAVYIPSYIQSFAGWSLIVLFSLFLAWPGQRD